MSEWISAKDQPPELDVWVIVYCEVIPEGCKEICSYDPYIFVARRGNYGNPEVYESAHGDGYINPYLKITHWMELPKPPEVVGE